MAIQFQNLKGKRATSINPMLLSEEGVNGFKLVASSFFEGQWSVLRYDDSKSRWVTVEVEEFWYTGVRGKDEYRQITRFTQDRAFQIAREEAQAAYKNWEANQAIAARRAALGC